MDRLKSIGSFGENARDLPKMNGRHWFDTGEVSQGAQELNQKVAQQTCNEWCYSKELLILLQRLNQSVNPYN